MFVKFDGSCLIKQNKFTFNNKVLNICIIYDLDSTLNNFDPNLENCLFGSVKITKSSNINKYVYNVYGLAFYSKNVFKYSDGSFRNNAIIFGVNGSENVLVLGKGIVKINNKTVNATKTYETNISGTKVKRVLCLHYNKQNSYIFANGNKITDFTAKDSEINSESICLGNISQDFSESNTKKQVCMDLCITLASIIIPPLLMIYKKFTSI